MNITAENLSNTLLKEKKKLEQNIIKNHMKNIEKKILVSSNIGLDYCWYSVDNHYKYTNLIEKIVKQLEKKKFAVRVFIKDNAYALQIIWMNHF
jgi:hypothetical protein